MTIIPSSPETQRPGDADPMKLTPALRDLLERIARGGGNLMAVQVTASGGRSNSLLNALIRAGYARKIDSPRLIDRRSGFPVEVLVITDMGTAAMARKAP